MANKKKKASSNTIKSNKNPTKITFGNETENDNAMQEKPTTASVTKNVSEAPKKKRHAISAADFMSSDDDEAPIVMNAKKNAPPKKDKQENLLAAQANPIAENNAASSKPQEQTQQVRPKEQQPEGKPKGPAKRPSNQISASESNGAGDKVKPTTSKKPKKHVEELSDSDDASEDGTLEDGSSEQKSDGDDQDDQSSISSTANRNYSKSSENDGDEDDDQDDEDATALLFGQKAAQIRKAQQAANKAQTTTTIANTVKKDTESESEDDQSTDDNNNMVSEARVGGDSDDEEDQSFEDLGLAPWLVSTLEQIGIKKPTPVQRNVIPKVLAGKDVIGSAQTGTGKTAAFALPVLHKLAQDPFGIYALIISPTRELAKQINDQIITFGRQINVRTELVIGGLRRIDQAALLDKKPHIVVGTPGRIKDHLAYYPDMFSKIKFLIIDEADRLVHPEFFQEMSFILGCLPPRRQTIVVSATMTKNVEKLRMIAMKDAFKYDACKQYTPVSKLTEQYLFIPEAVKDCYLFYTLLKNDKKSIIIFTETCRTCELLKRMLRDLGVTCKSIHALKTQALRLETLESFRSGRFTVLVATDVASRGLDIPMVDIVINYDVPTSVKTYMHRVGRTARAGRSGLAISLVTQYDVELLQNIEKHTGRVMTEYKTREEDVLEYMDDIAVARSNSQARLILNGFEEKVKEREQKKKEEHKKLMEKRKKRAQEKQQQKRQ